MALVLHPNYTALSGLKRNFHPGLLWQGSNTPFQLGFCQIQLSFNNVIINKRISIQYLIFDSGVLQAPAVMQLDSSKCDIRLVSHGEERNTRTQDCLSNEILLLTHQGFFITLLISMLSEVNTLISINILINLYYLTPLSINIAQLLNVT